MVYVCVYVWECVCMNLTYEHIVTASSMCVVTAQAIRPFHCFVSALHTPHECVRCVTCSFLQLFHSSAQLEERTTTTNSRQCRLGTVRCRTGHVSIANYSKEDISLRRNNRARRFNQTMVNSLEWICFAPRQKELVFFRFRWLPLLTTQLNAISRDGSSFYLKNRFIVCSNFESQNSHSSNVNSKQMLSSQQPAFVPLICIHSHKMCLAREKYYIRFGCLSTMYAITSITQRSFDEQLLCAALSCAWHEAQIAHSKRMKWKMLARFVLPAARRIGCAVCFVICILSTGVYRNNGAMIAINNRSGCSE